MRESCFSSVKLRVLAYLVALNLGELGACDGSQLVQVADPLLLQMTKSSLGLIWVNQGFLTLAGPYHLASCDYQLTLVVLHPLLLLHCPVLLNDLHTQKYC